MEDRSLEAEQQSDEKRDDEEEELEISEILNITWVLRVMLMMKAKEQIESIDGKLDPKLQILRRQLSKIENYSQEEYQQEDVGGEFLLSREYKIRGEIEGDIIREIDDTFKKMNGMQR